MRREILVYKHGALIGKGWFNLYVDSKGRPKRSKATLVDLLGAELEDGPYEMEVTKDVLIVIPTRVQ